MESTRDASFHDKMSPRIYRNRALCIWCGTIVESRHVHDYQTCPCGNLSVDGGQEYIRRVSSFVYLEMTEYNGDDFAGVDDGPLQSHYDDNVYAGKKKPD